MRLVCEGSGRSPIGPTPDMLQAAIAVLFLATQVSRLAERVLADVHLEVEDVQWSRASPRSTTAMATRHDDGRPPRQG
ncbi:hypothetical protein ACQP04_08585 [Pseudonocardia halophobica]|uniref:hypothetical protein n=1 Tax=Pseudonocardia halophobica TaxID=29401 RepID=UPI003D8C15C6